MNRRLAPVEPGIGSNSGAGVKACVVQRDRGLSERGIASTAFSVFLVEFPAFFVLKMDLTYLKSDPEQAAKADERQGKSNV